MALRLGGATCLCPDEAPPPAPWPGRTRDLSSKLARSFSRCSTCARLLPTSVKDAIFWVTVSKVAVTWQEGRVTAQAAEGTGLLAVLNP